MNVRSASTKDAQRCAEISALRSAKELRNLLREADTRWLVIEDDAGRVVGIGVIHLWAWNQVAWIWDLTIEEAQRGKGYGRALLKGIIQAARQMGARVLMDFGTPTPNACSLVDLYVKNGFRVCGSNDRWFANQKDRTAVFYGYDLR